MEAGDHQAPLALAPICGCCSVLVSQFRRLPPSKVSTWLHRGGERDRCVGESPTGCKHTGEVGRPMGAAETGTEQHPCRATEQTLTFCKLPILHHGGFVHLVLSEPGRNRDTHSHHPWAELAPESIPGLPQPSGCSGHPSCSSDPAKQKLYKTSRSGAGTATPWVAPCATAWREPQGSRCAGHRLCLLAEKGPSPHQGHPVTCEGREIPSCTTTVLSSCCCRLSSRHHRGPQAALLEEATRTGEDPVAPFCTSSPLNTALRPRKNRMEGLHRSLHVPPARSALQRGCLGAHEAGQSTGRPWQGSSTAGASLHTDLLEVLVCPDGR